MTPVEVRQGQGPVILGLPHTGTEVPPEVATAMNETGRALADTDWWIDRLYDGLLDDVTTVRATFHRYVIDANRDPSGESLYPGQNTTGLVPQTTFDGAPIWATPPDAAEVARRREVFHAPYHVALEREIARVLDLHGHVILYDCHSIRSVVPYLFEGTLPDFNIGTDNGKTCAAEIETAVTGVAAAADGYTHVVNGRFRGGWTTRHYGRPETGVHAIQMELAQSTYMDEAPPWSWRGDRAGRLRPQLFRILKTLAKWRPA